MRFLSVLLLVLAASTARAADPAIPESLQAYSGRVVYVDFWASWCTPCAESFPWLNAMQEKYGPRLAVVGVNVDTDARSAEMFLKRHPARFDILYDPQGRLAGHYRIEGMPSSVILDTAGRVLHQHSGFRGREAADYEDAIRRALAHGPQAGVTP